MTLRTVSIVTGLATALVACSGHSERSAPSAVQPDLSEPLATADDEATRWRAVSLPAAEGALGLSLRTDERGLLATWIEPSERGHRVRSARYDGLRWGNTVSVVEGTELIANWADFPRAARGGDGALYVSHLHRAGVEGHAYDLHLSRSDDGGRTFRALGPLHRDGVPTEHGFVSMAPTGSGVRLFWLDGRATVNEGGATAIYTAEVTDRVGRESLLDDRVCDCCQTDAALTDAGPLLVFRDRREAEEIRDISAATFAPDIDTPPRIRPVHEDGWEIAGCPVNGPAVDAHGSDVAAAWFTGATGGTVRVAFSDDGGATFATPVEVDPHQPVGRVDVVSLGDGAAVSWVARRGANVDVRVCFVGRDGRVGRAISVGPTTAGRAGGFPVMARVEAQLYLGYRDVAEPPRLRLVSLPAEALDRTDAAREAPSRSSVPVIGAPLPTALARDERDVVTPLAPNDGDRARLVAFYARWCQPCRDELQTLEQLRRERPDLRVSAVSIDEGSHARAARTARGWGYEGEVLRDAGAATALGVPPLPALFAVSAEGRLLWSSVGQPVSLETLSAAVPPRPDQSPGAVGRGGPGRGSRPGD